MKHIPLFDNLLSKIGFNPSENELPEIYQTMVNLLVYPNVKRREFYPTMTTLIPKQMQKDVLNVTTDNPEFMMWIQYLNYLRVNGLSGIKAIAALQDFKCKPEDLEIFTYLKNVPQDILKKIKTLPAPLNYKQFQKEVEACYERVEKIVNGVIYSRASFLSERSKENMRDIVADIKMVLVEKIRYHLHFLRGEDLDKASVKATTNYLINYIHYNTSGKRSHFTVSRDEDGNYNSFVNTTSATIEHDGESSDLFDTLNVSNACDEYNEITIRSSCRSVIENYKLKNINNEAAMVEVMKIISNENDEFLTWYNDKTGMDMTSPLDILEENPKGFMKEVCAYCKVPMTTMNNLLRTYLKPCYEGILEG